MCLGSLLIKYDSHVNETLGETDKISDRKEWWTERNATAIVEKKQTNLSVRILNRHWSHNEIYKQNPLCIHIMKRSQYNKSYSFTFSWCQSFLENFNICTIFSSWYFPLHFKGKGTEQLKYSRHTSSKNLKIRISYAYAYFDLGSVTAEIMDSEIPAFEF